jgi:hypothetical protein
MSYSLNGRKVVAVEIDHGRSGDIVDSFIIGGTWDDTGLELTDEELDALQDSCPDALTQQALEAGLWH